MINNLFLIATVGICISLASCEDYLAIEPPNNRLETSAVFADSTSAALAIIGAYSSIMSSSGGLIENQSRLAGLLSDELIYAGSSEPIAQFSNNSLISDNNLINTLWSTLYKNIYQVNLIIENVERSETIKDSAKSNLSGEAKFLRAFLYFYLTNNWGSVPLITGTDYRQNEKVPQSPSSEIYELIIADLKSAIVDLPVDYPTAERVRPNRMVAKAFLARIYLYRQNWEEAFLLSDEVLSSSLYPLESNLTTCFLKGSSETLWQLFSATSNMFYDTYDGAFFVPSSLTNATPPLYQVAPQLLQSFTSEDERRRVWVGTKATGPFFFPYKYTTRTRTGNHYTIVFRAAEQLLIRAESNLMRGDIVQAINDINKLRSRAKIASLPSNLNLAECQTALLEERKRELFCEWGHRWFDLKRLDMASDVIGSQKGEHWQATDTLLPIPQIQLLNAPQLVQNLGY